MFMILGILVVGTILTVVSLNLSIQKLKISSDYAHCRQAITSADAGVDRVMNDLLQTPDSDSDGNYDTTPAPTTLDTYNKPIFDIDQNTETDFYQLFDLGKNIPDQPTVSRANAVKLFEGASLGEVYVWVEADTPPGMATIHASGAVGRCTKTVHAIIQSVSGGPGAPTLNMRSPIMSFWPP